MSGDTIFACATGIGAAGVAIMRVSGSEALTQAEKICGKFLIPRTAHLCDLRSGSGDQIDEALVLYFPEGQSFSGEKTVEYQCHGSNAVMIALSEELQKHGARPAEPGEFTRRAFLNGRMDLAQVEGLSDLVQAETDFQRRQSLSVMQGALSKKTAVWRDVIVQALALVAATIDFADEEVPVDVTPDVEALLDDVETSLRSELDGLWFSERVRTGFEVALIGAPNVGKSTLLNALAGRDAAITSDIAGTTRDIVEVRLDLGGLPVTFLDTAGLRLSDDEIEKIGIERSQVRAAAADLRIFLGDDAKEYIHPEDQDIFVSPKADVDPVRADIGVSGKTGKGIDLLLEQVKQVLSNRAVGDTVATHKRHGEAIKAALNHLETARSGLGSISEYPELVTTSLADAASAISTLIGDVDVEHILDHVFSRFCVGK